MWYCAHILVSVRYREGNQDTIPLWENILLIQANSSDQAFREAERLAEEKYGIDDPLICDGRAAYYQVEGVRKIIRIEVPDVTSVPSGTEVTYLQIEVDTEQELELVKNGLTVKVIFDDHKVER